MMKKMIMVVMLMAIMAMMLMRIMRIMRIMMIIMIKYILAKEQQRWLDHNDNVDGGDYNNGD